MRVAATASGFRSIRHRASAAWVFVVRGFGVAVGTHSVYDVMVGWLGWHL